MIFFFSFYLVETGSSKVKDKNALVLRKLIRRLYEEEENDDEDGNNNDSSSSEEHSSQSEGDLETLVIFGGGGYDHMHKKIMKTTVKEDLASC